MDINVVGGYEHEGSFETTSFKWIGILEFEVPKIGGVGGFINPDLSNSDNSGIKGAGVFVFGNVGKRFYGGGINWDVDWRYPWNARH